MMLLQLLPEFDTQAIFLRLLKLFVLLSSDREIGLPQGHSWFTSISGKNGQVAGVTSKLVVELRILLPGVWAIFTFGHKDRLGILASTAPIHSDRGLNDLVEILPLRVGQEEHEFPGRPPLSAA